MNTLLTSLSVAILVLLLTSTVVTYLWSGDPARRDRAWNVVQTLLRVRPAGDRGRDGGRRRSAGARKRRGAAVRGRVAADTGRSSKEAR